MSTAVLAYSGGLDTSCAIAWLKEDYGFDEVVAVLVDVGQDVDFAPALRRGRLAGADDVVVVDRRDVFAEDQVAKALLANALYEGRYPLISALSRPVIAGAVSGGGYTPAQQNCSKTANATNAGQPGSSQPAAYSDCHNFTVQVNQGQFIELITRRAAGFGSRPGHPAGPSESIVDIPYPLLTESAPMSGPSSWSTPPAAP